MSSVSITARDIFWKFDKHKVRRIILAIFLIELAIFIYLYQTNRNLINTADNYLGRVQAPALLFNIYGTDKTPLTRPMSVTVSDNKIFVADTGNQRIQVFSSNGDPLFTFGKNGTSKGEFRFPYGIVADDSGKLYVSDLYNGNIQVFSKDGNFIRYFGSSADFRKPTGLFMDGKQLYVTDVATHKVSVFDLQGKKVREFGKKGKGPGEFNSPNAVAVANGNIVVSDSGNDRVQVFNKLGQFAYYLGESPKGGKTSFINPRGVGVDARGTIYVVNNIVNQVVGFNNKGEKLFVFGSMGNQPDQFYLPNGLFVDGQGRVFITDTVNQRVDVYQN
ncbi:MAG: 6-bladed beta-propeller [Bacillota bacterium]